MIAIEEKIDEIECPNCKSTNVTYTDRIGWLKCLDCKGEWNVV